MTFQRVHHSASPFGPPTTCLWSCPSGLLQALRKDLDLQGQVWLAELYNGGRLPVSVLCNVEKLCAWFKTCDAPAADCPYTMWQRISDALNTVTANDEGGLIRMWRWMG